MLPIFFAIVGFSAAEAARSSLSRLSKVVALAIAAAIFATSIVKIRWKNDVGLIKRASSEKIKRVNSLRLLIRAIAALGIIATSFLVTLWVMNYVWPPCPPGTATALMRPFQKYPASGFAYIRPSPEFDDISDFSDTPTRSNLLLCENNNLLGPMHTPHAEVAKDGCGRYSHWKNIGFIFSASDNTDPNTNGRNYWVVQPR